jgi:hypothetical protein
MQQLQRIGGGAGIVYGVVGMAYTIAVPVLFGRSGVTPDQFTDPVRVTRFFGENSVAFVGLSVAMILASVIGIGLVYALEQRLRHYADLSRLAGVFGYIAIVLGALPFMVEAIYARLAGGSAPAQRLAEAATPAVEVFLWGLGPAILVFLAPWAAMLSWMGLRANVFSRPLSYFGYLLSVMALVSLLASYLLPPGSPFSGLAFLLLVIWAIWVGATLVRRPIVY